MTFCNPNHNSLKIYPKSKKVLIIPFSSPSGDYILLKPLGCSFPQHLQHTIVQVQNNVCVSKHGIIHWRILHIKRTKSEQVCSIFLCRINFCFCEEAVKLSPQNYSFYFLPSQLHMSVLSLSHTHLHFYLPTTSPPISDCTFINYNFGKL